MSPLVLSLSLAVRLLSRYLVFFSAIQGVLLASSPYLAPAWASHLVYVPFSEPACRVWMLHLNLSLDPEAEVLQTEAGEALWG
jgi:hypothetical protein